MHPKANQKDKHGAKRDPKGSQKGAKVSQGTFKHINCGTGSKNIGLDGFLEQEHFFFNQNPSKNHIKNHSQK